MDEVLRTQENTSEQSASDAQSLAKMPSFEEHMAEYGHLGFLGEEFNKIEPKYGDKSDEMESARKRLSEIATKNLEKAYSVSYADVAKRISEYDNPEKNLLAVALIGDIKSDSMNMNVLEKDSAKKKLAYSWLALDYLDNTGNCNEALDFYIKDAKACNENVSSNPNYYDSQFPNTPYSFNNIFAWYYAPILYYVKPKISTLKEAQDIGNKMATDSDVNILKRFSEDELAAAYKIYKHYFNAFKEGERILKAK